VNALRRFARALLAALLLAAAAVPVGAHAELLASEPAAGATVPAGLREMTLTFSEPIGEGSQVVVYAEQFEAVAGVVSGVEGPVLHVLFTSALGEGVYTVQWTAVGTDGHPVEGTYQFAVSASFGAGMGPQIALAVSLAVGLLALAAIVVLSRRKRAIISGVH
jgi:methionine-rich copper-binding protein CopC